MLKKNKSSLKLFDQRELNRLKTRKAGAHDKHIRRKKKYKNKIIEEELW